MRTATRPSVNPEPKTWGGGGGGGRYGGSKGEGIGGGVEGGGGVERDQIQA